MSRRFSCLAAVAAATITLCGCDGENTPTTSNVTPTSTTGTTGSGSGTGSGTKASNVFANTYWSNTSKLKNKVVDRSDFRQVSFTTASAGVYSKIGWNYTATYSSYYKDYMWSTCCTWDSETKFTYTTNGNTATVIMGGSSYSATISGSSLSFDGTNYSK